MKVPYNWLREYIDIPFTPEELADKLTMGGIEVSSISTFAPMDEKLIVGRIEGIKAHPEDKNLLLADVDCGGEVLPIVCGAWNIKEGDNAALALSGAVLPSGIEIQEQQIKGVSSKGMLCSAEELGLEIAEEERGILILKDNCTPGEKLSDVLFVNEPVLELDLTPNRGDCLGLLGVAREVAAISGNSVKFPPSDVQERDISINEHVKVTILDPDLCYRYTARLMEGMRVAPSPLDIQLKLLSVGVRPISNVVDVTNYVMWETGHPTHAFDYECLQQGEIIVRRAREGENLVTLDGFTRELNEDNLVIADTQAPVGLAGVMGGEHTEITENTTHMLLEAACFNPFIIRRTARKFNLPSEASQRFERGVDPEGALFVQNRSVRLMQQLAGGEIYRGIVDVYPRKQESKRVEIRTERVEELLGYRVPASEIKVMLESLGLKVYPSKGTETDAEVYIVEVPSFRADLNIEEDLVEEVARLKGYEKIPSTMPYGVITSGRPSTQKRILKTMRDTLAALGLYEVITFSFMNPAFFDSLLLDSGDWRRNAVNLKNPLTEDQKVLRTTLISNLLQVLQYNFNRQVESQFIFELGSVFYPGGDDEKLLKENLVLSIALTGKIYEKDWSVNSQKVDFFYLKGIVESLLSSLGIGEFSWEADEMPPLHPAQGAKLKLGGENAGYLGTLHPKIEENLDLPQRVFVAELEIKPFLERASLDPVFKPLPRFPSLSRDMAFLIPHDVTAKEVFNAIKEHSGELLEDLRLFDVYQGKQIPQGHVSMAFSLTFRHPQRTLKDEDVDVIQQRIEQKLGEEYGASLRKI